MRTVANWIEEKDESTTSEFDRFLGLFIIFFFFGKLIFKSEPVCSLHCKKSLTVFPSLARMSLTKLSLAGNNLIFPGQGEFG